MRITNHTSQTLDFIVKGRARNGVPPTGSVAPGATEDLDVIEDARFRGALHAGAISVSAKAAEKVDPAPIKGK